MENQIVKTGFKNSLYVVSTQMISLMLGIAKVLVLPKLLGVTNFGYWQVYLLYLTYVGVLAFGFNDGIYLRYGKYDYNDLPKDTFRSSIKLFIAAQLVIMFLISFVILLEPNTNKQIALFWVVSNIPIAGITGIFIYVLQITNQLKKFSFFSVLDKIIILVIIGLIYILKSDNFVIVIIADTFSRFVVMIMLCISCRDLIFGRGSDFNSALHESIKNISVGIKLMLANFAGMFILGLGRFIVERFESVETYGIYSFAISTINLVLVFVSAIGLVVYPTFNRIGDDKYAKYFTYLNNFITIFVFGMLISYFPVHFFINAYFRDYIGIFEYLPIIFGIIVIQSKMQILINPYYKLLREEKAMLKANINGLLLSAIIVIPLYIITKSVTLVALGTFLAMTVRLYLSEIYLKKKLGILLNKNIVLELIGIVLFFIFTYQSNWKIGFYGALLIYIIYLIFSKKTIMLFKELFIRG